MLFFFIILYTQIIFFKMFHFLLIINSMFERELKGLIIFFEMQITFGKEKTYFGSSRGLYALTTDDIKATKIKGIDDKVLFLTIDQDNNIYFATEDNDIFIYKNDTSIVKIEGVEAGADVTALALDSMNNLYLGTLAGIYYLPAGETVVEKVSWGDYVIFALIIDDQDDVYFTTNKRDFFSYQRNKEDPLVLIQNLNELIYTMAIDQTNNIYLGNYIYQTKTNELNQINLRDRSIYSIAVDANDNIYYCSFLDGVYFLKKGADQVIKTNLFGREVQTIAVDANANIFVNNNEGSFIFQIYNPPIIPDPVVKPKDMVVAKVLGYVFLGTSGAVGISCLGTYLWNKYRYKKSRRR
ncbi:putative Adhesion Related Protein 4 [Spiroplasma poulsonii]|uniref:Putative Adhesion Related Protein 4 n=2 Tax=Spiroplasma poulsonii TaxID=2138 RepID=A0A2P6FGD1_9MOLU|nr:putative Adhesion Related Protein 4 [Spiroplasma poulsonii]